MGLWAKIRKDFVWAAIIALCGATAGVVFVAVTDGPVFSEIWKGAVTGALVVSVIYTAIRSWLDL